MPAERADDMRDRSQSVNSIASLGSFPSPPSHFPLPPVQSNLSPISSESASSSQSQAQPVPSPSRGTPTTPRADSANNSATFLDFGGGTPPTPPAAPIHDSPRSMKTPFPTLHDDDDGARSSQTHESVEPSPSPQQPRALPKPAENDVNTREERPESDELGRRADVPRAVKRSDTNRSSGSVVAAMRDKLVRSVRLFQLSASGVFMTVSIDQPFFTYSQRCSTTPLECHKFGHSIRSWKHDG